MSPGIFALKKITFAPMKYLKTKDNFLGIPSEKHYNYKDSKFVIQQVPYEYTSSYLSGSIKGPKAMVKASQFVELYDEELGKESYLEGGICTAAPMDFKNKTNKKAVDYIAAQTEKHVEAGKFVVSLGAEHTVTAGLVKPYAKRYKNLTVLQIDAHSDLRERYHNNKYSHASAMARVRDEKVNLVQIGIRAQCIEEREVIRTSKDIHTFYAHYIRSNSQWMDEVLKACTDDVYITIDADGFDPSVIPAVGTAEPNGLGYTEGVDLLKRVIAERNVVGFDVVECAPIKGSILSEYTLAKLIYKMIGYITLKK
jgi:agmatinase